MTTLNIETNQDTLLTCCFSLSHANNYMRGAYAPHYPVPALRTDMLYWRMPSYPTNKLVAQWYLWAQGWRPAYYTYDAI